MDIPMRFEGKGFATVANAVRKLKPFEEALQATGLRSFIAYQDGRFYPVVVWHERANHRLQAFQLANHGIYCVN